MIGGFMRKPSSVDIREQEVKKRMDKYKYKSKLYHYTSITALVEILREKELWLGNTATMNDKSEIIHFIRKLQTAVLKDISQDKIEEGKLFFSKLYDRLENEYPFAISFSTLRDNAAQWERYADDAHGACIVFDTSKLLNLFWHSGASLYDISYECNIKEHELYSILKDYINDGEFKKVGNEEGGMDQILGCAYRYKHESFNTESEIRLSTLWNYKIVESKFDFKMINGKLKKVLKISLDKLCSEEGIDFEELIDSIVLGPRSEQNESELSEYLETIGYKEICKKVSRSECPLR